MARRDLPSLPRTCATLGIAMASRKGAFSPERLVTCVEYWLDRCYLWKPSHREEALKIAMEMVK